MILLVVLATLLTYLCTGLGTALYLEGKSRSGIESELALGLIFLWPLVLPMRAILQLGEAHGKSNRVGFFERRHQREIELEQLRHTHQMKELKAAQKVIDDDQ